MNKAQSDRIVVGLMLVAELSTAGIAWGGGAGIAAATFESSSLSLKVSGPDLSRASSQSSDGSNSNGSNSSNQSSEGSSGDSSGSSSDDGQRKKPRKLAIPQQVRDEAVLFLAGSAAAPPSALLRSTVQAFRQVLIEEGRRSAVGHTALSDREVLAVLLQRTEGTENAPAQAVATAEGGVAAAPQLVHAQAVRGAQPGRAQSRVQRRKQADEQGHAADERHLERRDIRR